MYKRITSMLLMSIVLVLGFGILINSISKGQGLPLFTLSDFIKGEYTTELEEYAATNFPAKESLQSFAIGLKLAAGQTEQQDIFIGDDQLIEDQPSPNRDYVRKNTSALLSFAKKSYVPVYCMLIPTKCAIEQQALPEIEYISLFNQKEFMEETYDLFSGKISSVDPYPPLFSNQHQYVYYKTDPALTALGSYYVYTVLASRLNVEPRPVEDFSIEHIKHNFYGKTFARSPYKDISPDMISVYRLKEDYTYSVTHRNTDTPYAYSTLYPTHWADTNFPLNVYLGGNTGDIEIKTYGSSNGRKLLVFGDNSMMPVLGLLSTNYDEIRFIDLGKLEREAIYGIDVNYYDQVLFAYSVDTFTQSESPAAIKYS